MKHSELYYDVQIADNTETRVVVVHELRKIYIQIMERIILT